MQNSKGKGILHYKAVDGHRPTESWMRCTTLLFHNEAQNPFMSFFLWIIRKGKRLYRRRPPGLISLKANDWSGNRTDKTLHFMGSILPKLRTLLTWISQLTFSKIAYINPLGYSHFRKPLEIFSPLIKKRWPISKIYVGVLLNIYIHIWKCSF